MSEWQGDARIKGDAQGCRVPKTAAVVVGSIDLLNIRHDLNLASTLALEREKREKKWEESWARAR